jgi:hypothetical protein
MRKLLLAALVGLLLGSCTWQQHRGNAGHTGFQPSETRISTATVASVGEIWTAALPPSASPPVVAGGSVYVGGGDYPNGRGAIMAFDAAGEEGCSGTPRVCTSLWHETTSSGISSTPAVVNGVLYAADEMGGLLAPTAWSTSATAKVGCRPTPSPGRVGAT